ncbi:DUF7715 family protein [Streptomyces sp. NPDC005131]
MKLLAATGEVRAPDGDFNWCDDDELVLGAVGVCASGDACGCSRAWVGLKTLKGSTLAKVVEVDITARRFKELLLDAGMRMGYIEPGRTTNVSFVRVSYLEIVRTARQHEVGTVLKYTHTGPQAAAPTVKEHTA